ncbi:zinc-dependent metalloprotease [Virgibacillus salexigens]|uniref:Peptidase M84 n=1 Tax=Virgibacillus kapii TaxID=1638645 RepID=A0ABQ2DFP6_9BACI|nr:MULTISPECIES: zinc-dependent metalloprotease [Virgibacillus]GGJ54797.1 hypothetical protein GCM10007111_16360 [Virgibacillus kapii]
MYLKRVVSIALAFSILSSPITVLGSASSVHHHNHTESTMYMNALPKAKENTPDEGPAKIEKSTKVIEFGENGEIKDITSTEKTVSPSISKRSGVQPQASRTVTVLAVADEEYRTAYSDWQNRVQQIVENADDAFIRDHEIDFQVQAVASWTSQGANSGQILADLSVDHPGQNYDFVVGFTNDVNFDAGGIAYVYNTDPGTAFSVNLDQGITNTSKAAQHEFSHNYGLGHDPQGSGIQCIMNYDYAYSVDYWDPAHNNQIANNKYWYGQ